MEGKWWGGFLCVRGESGSESERKTLDLEKDERMKRKSG